MTLSDHLPGVYFVHLAPGDGPTITPRLRFTVTGPCAAPAGAGRPLGTVDVRTTSGAGPMVTCRCKILNVASGAVARELLDRHLGEVRTDGMGRSVYRCEDTDIEWLEDHQRGGYDHETIVLRRVNR